MAEVKPIDLSVLTNLNIPTIDFEQSSVAQLSEEDIEQLKELAIDEVENLETFVGTDEEDPDESGSDNPGTTNTQTQTTNTDELSPVRALAEWAGEKGIFEFDPEKFEDNEEFLETKIKETIDKGVSSFKESLPEEIHKLIENYQEGVPLDELIYSKSREIEYKGIDEDKITDNVDLQKRLVSEWIANTDPDATQEEIDKKLKKYEDSLLLEDEAKTALKKLQKFEAKYQESLVQEAKNQKIAEKKRFEETIANLEKQVMSTEEILPGIKLSKEDRKKLFEIYTKTDSKGQTALMKKMAADPLANLKIAQLFGLYDGKLDTIKTSLKTQVAAETKKTVNTYSDKSPLNKINLTKLKQGMALIKKG